jgi:hypothetical protein
MVGMGGIYLPPLEEEKFSKKKRVLPPYLPYLPHS